MMMVTILMVNLLQVNLEIPAKEKVVTK
jgi:hypothetical protein